MTHDLDTRFRRHVTASGLFDEPGRALVAVSGGPDSRALLELMVRAAGALRVTPVVGCVDHGIASGSAAWSDGVRAVAEGHGLPFVVERLDLGAGTSETVAREGRYRALRRMQRRTEAPYLVTAHHADDQAETVLFRLIRGSGVAGLAGIAARGPAGLRRPLLPFRSAELREWLDVAVPGHGSIADPANADARHDRSWMRTTLLPLVRERFPEVDRRLLDAARDAAEHRGAWSAIVRTHPALDLRPLADGVEVARGSLQSYDKTLSLAMLRAVGRETGCVIGARHADRLLRFAAGPSGRVLELGDGWIAEVVFDRLRIHRPTIRPPAGPVAVRWGGAVSGEASWDGWCITWSVDAAARVRRDGWTTWVTEGAGLIRAVRAGDLIRPVGGTGRRRVRRVLMEGRVPRGERRRWPVLERDGAIVWVPGICRSAAAVPRPGEAALRVDAHRHRDQ